MAGFLARACVIGGDALFFLFAFFPFSLYRGCKGECLSFPLLPFHLSFTTHFSHSSSVVSPVTPDPQFAGSAGKACPR